MSNDISNENLLIPLTTIEWIEQVRIKINAKSDIDIARALKIKKQTISQQLLKQHTQMPLQALRIARILEISPILVIACACWELARNEEDKFEWQVVFSRNSGGTFIRMSQPE